jgi:hypothetical protein
MAERHLCACGRDAIDVMHVASEDGLLLIPVCAECIEVGDAAGGEQGELFGRAQRRPLSAMPARDGESQPQLPLGDVTDVDDGEQQGAA